MTRVHNIHVHREDVGGAQPLRALQPVKIAKTVVLLAFLLRAWRKEEGEVAYLLF